MQHGGCEGLCWSWHLSDPSTLWELLVVTLLVTCKDLGVLDTTRPLHIKFSYWQQQKCLQLPLSWQLINEQRCWGGLVGFVRLAAVCLHLCAVQLDGPHRACCPHHLNLCRWQDQPHLGLFLPPPPPPHAGSSVSHAGPAWSQPVLCKAQQNSASCATGNHPLVLKHNQPQVLAQLSPSCSEDELLPHLLQDYPAWPGFLPRVLLPCQAKPSERAHTLWLELSPPPLLRSTRSPHRGDISSIPWCLFSSARC